MPTRTYKAPKRPKRPLGATKYRKKVKSLATLKKEVWELCKGIVRKRYQNRDGTWNCYTCDRRIDEPAKAHTGHFIASSVGGVLLRYNLNNLRIQCYNCNINKSGNWPSYLESLTKELGDEKLKEMIQMRNLTAKADLIWYSKIIEEYAEILQRLH